MRPAQRCRSMYSSDRRPKQKAVCATEQRPRATIRRSLSPCIKRVGRYLHIVHLSVGWNLTNLDLKRQLYAIARTDASRRGVRGHGVAAVGSAIGLVRPENEDVAMHVSIRHPRSASRLLSASIVCDGMGGMRFGKEAAAIATASFIAGLTSETQITADACLRAIKLADDAVHQRFQGRGGTTLSAVVTSAEGLSYAVHAGDSRIYEIDDEWNIDQVSHDDNLRGALPPTQSIDEELGARLVQYVGMGEEIEPHIFRITATASRVMLTTDGAHLIEKGTFKRILKHSSESDEAIRKIINVADYIGGIDNASVVISPVGRIIGEISLDGMGPDILHVFTAHESIQIWGGAIFQTASQAGPQNLEGATVGREQKSASTYDQKSPSKKTPGLEDFPEPKRPASKTPTNTKSESTTQRRKKLLLKRKKPAQKSPELDLSAPPKVSVKFDATDDDGGDV